MKLVYDEIIANKRNFSLIFIHLNKFNVINHVFGHSTGDQLLIKFSNIIKDSFGDRGIVTRYSGDEFIIIYKGF